MISRGNISTTLRPYGLLSNCGTSLVPMIILLTLKIPARLHLWLTVKFSATIVWIAMKFGKDSHFALSHSVNLFGCNVVGYLLNTHKTNGIPIILSCTMCLVLISKC